MHPTILIKTVGKNLAKKTSHSIHVLWDERSHSKEGAAYPVNNFCAYSTGFTSSEAGASGAAS